MDLNNVNLFRCSPRTTSEYVTDCLFADVVPYVTSSPGMGKSAIIKSIAKMLNLKVIDHRLSTSVPEDMTGLPRFDEKGHAYFAPFRELFPLEDAELPEGYEGWLIFFDEFPSASRAVQAAAYKVILDRMVGQRKLHERVKIACAGNLASDNAIVNPMGTAMQSRLVHIEMECNFEEWLQDVAMPNNYDKRIISFLGTNPSKLMVFNPDHDDKTFACPRTWEIVNKLLIANPDMSARRATLFAGVIGHMVASEFFMFTEVFDRLVKISDVLRSPETCAVPRENALKWSTVTSIVEAVTKDTLEKFCKYIARFDVTFQILFYRFLAAKDPEIRKHPAFAAGAISIINYLN